MNSSAFIDLSNPFVFLNLVALILIILYGTHYLINDRSQNRPFLLGLFISMMIWLLFTIPDYSSHDLNTKILLSQLTYFGITTVPVFYLLSVLSFLGLSKFTQKKTVTIAFIIPIITIIGALTNQWHHLIWTKITWMSESLYPMAEFQHGWLYWVGAIGYSYALLMIALVIVVRRLIATLPVYREPLFLMLASGLTPLLGNLLYLFDKQIFPGYDPAPAFTALSGYLLIRGMVTGRFSVVPSIHIGKVMDEFAKPIFICEPDDKLVFMNWSAKKLITLSPNVIQDKDHGKLVIGSVLAATSLSEGLELRFEVDNHERLFVCRRHAMTDVYKNNIGTTILLEEVTSLQNSRDEALNTTINVQRLALSHQTEIGLDRSISSIQRELQLATNALTTTTAQLPQAIRSIEKAKTLLTAAKRILTVHRTSLEVNDKSFTEQFQEFVHQFMDIYPIAIEVSFPNEPLNELIDRHTFTILTGVIQIFLLNAGTSGETKEVKVIFIRHAENLSVYYSDDSPKPLEEIDPTFNKLMESIGGSIEFRSNTTQSSALLSFKFSRDDTNIVALARQSALFYNTEALFADTLQFGLATQGLDTLGNFSDPRDVERILTELRPHMLFVSIRQGDESAGFIELCLKADRSTSIILIYSDAVATTLEVAAAIEPAGVISHTQKMDSVIQATAMIQNGGKYIEPRIAELLRNYGSYTASEFMKKTIARLERQGLNRKQITIFLDVLAGKTYRQIAYENNLTESDVKYHVKRIMVLLNTDSRSALLQYGADLGLGK